MAELVGERAVHVCIDMQRMFAEATEWHAPWLESVLHAVADMLDASIAGRLETIAVMRNCA